MIAGITPMSIFVLNLATLLGLGLGVDYSLLLTSRFREEMAAPRRTTRRTRGSPPPSRRRCATAGRAVFFSGLTVLLGLAGLVLFEFMILRSVGIAGAIVVLLAASVRADAAARPAGDRRPPDRRAGDPPGRPARRPGRTVGASRPLGDAAAGRGPRPDARRCCFVARLCRSSTSGSTRRTRRSCPPTVPSRAAFDRLADAFGEGEFAPIVLAIRTTGPATSPANVAALYDYSRRLAADPRIRRIDSLVDVDPRLTEPQYQLLYADPNGPRDRFVATALAATTKDDLTAFTITTPYGPNRDEGRQLVADLRRPGGALAPPAGMSVLVGGGAADVADVVDRVAAGLPADRPVHPRDDLRSSCSCSCARWSCRPRRSS